MNGGRRGWYVGVSSGRPASDSTPRSARGAQSSQPRSSRTDRALGCRHATGEAHADSRSSSARGHPGTSRRRVAVDRNWCPQRRTDPRDQHVHHHGRRMARMAQDSRQQELGRSPRAGTQSPVHPTAGAGRFPLRPDNRSRTGSARSGSRSAAGPFRSGRASWGPQEPFPLPLQRFDLRF